MTRATYTGIETLTFMDYMDLESGRTLTAEPGGVYDLAPSGGRQVPDLPPGFAAAEKPRQAKAGTAGDDGPGPEPEADGQPVGQ